MIANKPLRVYIADNNADIESWMKKYNMIWTRKVKLIRFK